MEPGEVKQQPRRMYKYVASNFRFRKKFDVDISDKIDNPKWFNILDIRCEKQEINCYFVLQKFSFKILKRWLLKLVNL